jgi:uncharacterized protein YybS (DUF2232 family)
VNRTRVITEAAIMTALYIVLLLMAVYLPLLGFLIMFVLPLPFIVFTTKHGFRTALLLALVAIIATAAVGQIAALPVSFMFGSSGIVVGYLFKKQFSSFAIMLGGSLAYLLNFILLYVGSILLFKIDIIKSTKEMLHQSVSMAESMISSLGQEPNNQLEVMKESIDLIEYVLPSALVFTGILTALITQLIASVVLKRLGIKVSEWKPFREWSFPRSLLWYYLIVTIIYMVGVEQGTVTFTIVINLFTALELIMTIQGLSFIFYYSWQKGWSKGIPVAIAVFSFLLPVLLYLVRILGIIDLGFDLRKKVKKD